jgi:hypothetical protein
LEVRNESMEYGESMSHIRQALHVASRHYAKQAHLAWIAADNASLRMFTYAVTGKQIERRLETVAYLNSYGQYRSHLNKAQRAREMMQ